MSSSEPSTTNVNLRKTPPKKNRWSPPIMEITPQGSQSALLLPAKVIVLFAFTVPFLRFFCWRVPFYWMFCLMLELESSKKKRDGWWLYWLLILHNSRIIFTKNQPLPFSKLKPSRYVCNCWSHPWRSSKKKRNTYHHQKQQHSSCKKQQKQKLLQLQVKKLAYLPYRCALSIRHLYRSHPLWLAAFGPNDTVSRQWQSWSILLGYK